MESNRGGLRPDLRIHARDNDDCVRDDIARYLDAPPELHAQDLEAVCRVVAETLRNRADVKEVLEFQDRRSPAVESFWKRWRSQTTTSTAFR